MENDKKEVGAIGRSGFMQPNMEQVLARQDVKEKLARLGWIVSPPAYQWTCWHLIRQGVIVPIDPETLLKEIEDS